MSVPVNPDSVRIRVEFAKQHQMDSGRAMKRQGFLDDESRRDLIELARYGLVANRLSHSANALVLLDGGMTYAAVAKVLLLVAERRAGRICQSLIVTHLSCV